MTKVADMFKSEIAEVRKSWVWFLVLGILLILLGALCIVKSQTATSFSILVLGWLLAISGVLWLVAAVRGGNWSLFFLYLLNALISGGVGYLLITHPNAGAEGVTALLAVWFIVGGLYRVVVASVIQFPYWGLTVLAGLISVGLGIYLLATWPQATTFFLGVLVGVDLICDGAALVGFSSAVHSLPAD